MKEIQEIEDRWNQIQQRLAEILLSFSKDKSDASALAEEFALLVHESKVIQHNMKFIRMTTKMLLENDCNGPH